MGGALTMMDKNLWDDLSNLHFRRRHGLIQPICFPVFLRKNKVQ